MRFLWLSVLILGFVMLDAVVILAMTNMLGWTQLSTELLIWLMLVAVGGMAGGLLVIRRTAHNKEGHP